MFNLYTGFQIQPLLERENQLRVILGIRTLTMAPDSVVMRRSIWHSMRGLYFCSTVSDLLRGNTAVVVQNLDGGVIFTRTQGQK